jgi:hypothetical protein
LLLREMRWDGDAVATSRRSAPVVPARGLVWV